MRRWCLCATALAGAVVASAAQADERIPVRLCTGDSNGLYYRAGQLIQQNLENSTVINMSVVESKGSWDNMKKMRAGECDAAISQPDAYMLWNQQNPDSAVYLFTVSELFKEYVHGVCRTETDVDNIGDLQLDEGWKIMVGPQGSGAWVTWNFWVEDDPDFEVVAQQNIGGTLGMARLANGGAQAPDCAIFVAGLGAPHIKRYDKTYADRTELVDVADDDFNDLLDSRGNQIYTSESIPGGTYDNWQSGWFFTSVDSVSMRTMLYVNGMELTDEDAVEEFILGVEQTRPQLLQLVSG